MQPRQQFRSLVIGKVGEKWRVTTVPPAPECEPDIPPFDEFDGADGALGYASQLAWLYGWNVIDTTGTRSDAEIYAAIEYAGSLSHPDEPDAA
jgi:hypothetical protein